MQIEEIKHTNSCVHFFASLIPTLQFFIISYLPSVLLLSFLDYDKPLQYWLLTLLHTVPCCSFFYPMYYFFMLSFKLSIFQYLFFQHRSSFLYSAFPPCFIMNLPHVSVLPSLIFMMTCSIFNMHLHVFIFFLLFLHS